MNNPCIARVLVVENDPQARAQLIEILTEPGMLVQAAEGQGPALQTAAKQLAIRFRPHVVVMDLRLVDDEYNADRSGLELLKDQSFASSRCVLHSAFLNYDFNVIRDAFLEARVADVVGKGDDPQRLIEAVKNAAREGCICRREFSIEWPTGWDENTVITTLFEDATEIPTDVVIDIVGHLFPEARKVTLEPLKGAAKASASVYRGRSVLFQARADNREPVVVKMAPRHRTAQEVSAYEEHIKDRLAGNFYAQLRDHKKFWDLGGICYSFIGSSEKAIETFAVFFQQQPTSDKIIQPLRHFFNHVWRRRYQQTHAPLVGSLFQAYQSFLKFQRLGQPQDHEETVVFPGLEEPYPNPLRWIIEHGAESIIDTAQQAVTHGDAHGDNMFIEGEHAWAIDFERSGLGPILRDFVELEQDIMTRLVSLPDNDLRLFRELALAVTTPVTPSDGLSIPKDFHNGEITKALEVIQALRSVAHEVTGYQDVREYYWGLLFDSAFAVTSAEKGSTRWWRALLFASILCSRLEHWGSDWPLADESPTSGASTPLVEAPAPAEDTLSMQNPEPGPN